MSKYLKEGAESVEGLMTTLQISGMMSDGAKKYFKNTAINIDKFGNREFRTLWNKTLIKKTDINSETLEKPFRQH